MTMKTPKTLTTTMMATTILPADNKMTKADDGENNDDRVRSANLSLSLSLSHSLMLLRFPASLEDLHKLFQLCKRLPAVGCLASAAITRPTTHGRRRHCPGIVLVAVVMAVAPEGVGGIRVGEGILI